MWEHFLDSFCERFQDSTKENRARNDLEKLQLKLPLIDEYTSKFKELARQAGYLAGNPETRQLFLHGLPRQVLEEVMRGGTPLTYQDLHSRATDKIARSIMGITDTMIKEGKAVPHRGSGTHRTPPDK